MLQVTDAASQAIRQVLATATAKGKYLVVFFQGFG